MDPGKEASSTSDEKDPFQILGVDPGSNFEVIQKARDLRLIEVKDDPIAKAKVEAAYDSLLMVSLKERQLGKASGEALIASKKEKVNPYSFAFFSKFKKLPSLGLGNSENSFLPNLNFVAERGLVIRVALGLLAISLAFISPFGFTELILSVSTLGLFASQIARGRKVFPSLFWSVFLLSFGLVIGATLASNMAFNPDQLATFPKERLQTIIALLFIWIGSLLFS